MRKDTLFTALLITIAAFNSACTSGLLEMIVRDFDKYNATSRIAISLDDISIENNNFSYSFGTTTADGNEGTVSNSIVFQVINNGTKNLQVTSVGLSDGSISDFDLTNSVPLTLQPAGIGSFAIRFDPLTIGDKVAEVTVASDDPDAPSFSFSLTGTGSAIPLPDIVLKNAATTIPQGSGLVDFGYEKNTGTGTEIIFTIENNGSADLTLSGSDMVQISPTTNGFIVSQQPPATIAANSSTIFKIAFSAPTVGVKTSTVTINSNDPDSPAYTFSIRGVGVAKIMASDGVANDYLGRSVAISGSTMIAGAPGSAGPGCAYIYRWNGSSWIQEQKLVASDGANGDMFGLSVSISGNYAVVGARYHKVGSNNGQGSAYIYFYDGSTWTQQAVLLAGDGAANDTFGCAVGISGDNVIIGARGCSTSPKIAHGAAYIFKRSGTTWAQIKKLLASDSASEDHFGDAVAISGSYAIIGANDRDDMGTGSGAVYAYWYNGLSWGTETKIVASDGQTGDFFGNSVAAYQCFYVIGAVGDDDNGINAGSAYLYWQNPDSMIMVPQGKVIAPDGNSGDAFGRSVSRSSNYIVIGADLAEGKAYDSGKAYLFTYDPLLSAFTCAARYEMNDSSSSDWFGHSVAVDGSNAVAGAPYNSEKASTAGAAYIIHVP